MPSDDAGGGEQEAPVFDDGVEGDGFLAGEARDQEGMFVGAFEEVRVAGEVAAELGDEGLLFGEGVGAVGKVGSGLAGFADIGHERSTWGVEACL